MFDNFSSKITKIFSQIAGKKFISEDDLNTTMREVRIALLEADVALPIAKNFIEQVKSEALGKQVIKSIEPGQMIIKILHDELVKLLGDSKAEINFGVRPPIIILMVGLQGAGKTTSSAKLALYLKNKNHKKVLLTSLDTYRPAAIEQLRILSEKISVDCTSFTAAKKPLQLAKEAKQKAIEGGYEVLILDSAGRTSINEEMMQELVEVANEVTPTEILLVVDAMIGQDAANVAKNFGKKLSLTGIILTRLDGDSRGGAALTMKAATNCPIKFIGIGEKLDEFETFSPDRIVSRIVGRGDVVSLVEKAQEIFDAKEMEKAAKKMQKGQFDFNDLLSQIRNMKKMGGLTKVVNLLPGASKIKKHLGEISGFEQEMKRQEAIILSMTSKERNNPEILNSSRKHRIARGAGTTIQEVNRLMKKYKQAQKMMKKFGKIDPNKLKEPLQNQDFLRDF